MREKSDEDTRTATKILSEMLHIVTHGVWELSQAGNVDPEALGARAWGELIQKGHPLFPAIFFHQARHMTQRHLQGHTSRDVFEQ